MLLIQNSYPYNNNLSKSDDTSNKKRCPFFLVTKRVLTRFLIPSRRRLDSSLRGLFPPWWRVARSRAVRFRHGLDLAARLHRFLNQIVVRDQVLRTRFFCRIAQHCSQPLLGVLNVRLVVTPNTVPEWFHLRRVPVSITKRPALAIHVTANNRHEAVIVLLLRVGLTTAHGELVVVQHVEFQNVLERRKLGPDKVLRKDGSGRRIDALRCGAG